QDPDPAEFYGEGSVDDDLALAGAALFQATGEPAFRDEALAHARRMKKVTEDLYWGDVGTIALMETGLTYPPGSPERAEMAEKLRTTVAGIAASDQKATGPGAP